MAKVYNIDRSPKFRRAKEYQLASCGNCNHIKAEVVRRWHLRQSVETIARRMHIGSLFVQEMLREAGAILPPIGRAA